MSIQSFRELAAAVQAQEKKSRVAVVAADDAPTLEAVIKAQESGLIEAFLIGRRAMVEEGLARQGVDPTDFQIVEADSVEACLARAVELIGSNAADLLMKGHLETADFMRAVLDRKNDLRKSPLLSVAGLYEMNSYHKLIAVSDQAINTYPDLDAKRAILENAVGLLHACGFDRPRVAVLAAIEKVNPKMRETVDADALKAMNREGVIAGCVVDGPLSLDIATDRKAAQIKGYVSEVAGDADCLIVPDLVCGNVFVKALTGFAGAMTAGIVVGAKVPIVLTPRSAEASDKFYSIALAAYSARQR
jgi:phosphotransacetylase